VTAVKAERPAGSYTQMTRQQAEEITRTIKSRCEEIWDLLVEAYNRRADLAMGYASWDEYCTIEFRQARIQVPAEERKAVVNSMRQNGMSTRAIASATGSSATTVRRDLADGPGPWLVQLSSMPAPGAPDGAPALGGYQPGPVATVTGLDQRRHPATQPRRRQPADPAVTGASQPRRSEPYAVGVPGHMRPIADPGWGLLANALQVFVDDPAPVAKLSKKMRAQITRNLAQIQEMLQ
jgi:uncharacterized protein YerC